MLNIRCLRCEFIISATPLLHGCKQFPPEASRTGRLNGWKLLLALFLCNMESLLLKLTLHQSSASILIFGSFPHSESIVLLWWPIHKGIFQAGDHPKYAWKPVIFSRMFYQPGASCHFGKLPRIQVPSFKHRSVVVKTCQPASQWYSVVYSIFSD